MNDISWDELDLRKFYSYSSLSLVISRLLVYPPILLKTRMQTQAVRLGMLDTAKNVVKEEGIVGLFKGAAAVSFGTLPTQAIYLTVLESSRFHVAHYLKGMTGIDAVERMAASAVSGGVASCFSAVLGVSFSCF
jgi:hypothetical protein